MTFKLPMIETVYQQASLDFFAKIADNLECQSGIPNQLPSIMTNAMNKLGLLMESDMCPVDRYHHTVVSSMVDNHDTPEWVVFRREVLPDGRVELIEYLRVRQYFGEFDPPTKTAMLSDVVISLTLQTGFTYAQTDRPEPILSALAEEFHDQQAKVIDHALDEEKFKMQLAFHWDTECRYEVTVYRGISNNE